MRKAHDDFKEIFAVGFRLGDGHGTESFQIAADAVFLLDGEANTDQSLEKIYSVNRGDEVLVPFLPPDTTDADAAWLTILRGNSFEFSSDGAIDLAALELD